MSDTIVVKGRKDRFPIEEAPDGSWAVVIRRADGSAAAVLIGPDKTEAQAQEISDFLNAKAQFVVTRT